MGLWERFKEFDKMMSEPAVMIRIEKNLEMKEDPEKQELIQENRRLNLVIKRMIENGIREIDVKQLE